jgi:hypothetical protein
MIQTIFGLIGIGLALIAIGIAVLTTDKVAHLPGMTEIRRDYIGWSVLILGFFFSFISVAIGAFRLFYKASIEFQVSISPRVLEKFEYEFDDEYCSVEKIKEVMMLDDSVLVRLSHIDEDFLLQRHLINDGIIRCVRKTKSKGNQLSGFYIIYPINEECEKLIEQGYLIGSRMIRPEHICKTFDEASAIYISAVYGRDMPTRGFIVYLLKRDLRDILRNNKRIRHVYSRPASSEGHLLVKKFKFSKMPTNPEMYRYVVDQS